MNQHPFVSIIIPVYKVERYLRECLDSIISQSFSDFEIILVDDGSPDNSGKICDEYSQKDPRIVVIHKENEGVAVARKTGVRNAKGEWITFVDSDDSLPPLALANLTEFATEEFDIITASSLPKRYGDVISTEQYRHFMLRGGYGVGSSPWAKLIRKEICLGAEFPRLKKAQDMCANIKMAFYNEKPVRLITKSVYNYRWDNPTSTVHTFRHDMQHMQDIRDILFSSIPKGEVDIYKEDIVVTLSGCLSLICYDNKENVWQGTELYREFEQLVRECNYKLPLLWRIKFSSRSSFVIKSTILIEGWIGMARRIKNGIKRRLF